jgi:transcription antitermination protein NusB
MAASGRHGARRLLVQALYQQQVGGHSHSELVAQFATGADFERVDGEYFLRLLEEILADTSGLDSLIAADADRPVAQLDPVERGILWLGLAELKMHPEVPVRVVINEAVNLAREFGAQDGHRYINAILDQMAPRLR